MIKLECNGKVRYVRNIYFRPSFVWGFVNEGRDDLYDLGFTFDDIENHEFHITVGEPNEKE